VIAARGEERLTSITLCQQGSAPQELPDQLAVRLHRGVAPDRLARLERGPGSARLRPDRPGPAGVVVHDAVAAGPGAVRPGDERARRLRGRGRAPGLHEAGGRPPSGRAP
jgi:hypothetical protein